MRFNCILKYLSLIGDTCIIIITLYTFYITYISKKISLISIGQNKNSWEGDEITITLFNETFTPLSITSLYIVIDNSYQITLRTDDPYVIEARKSLKITIGPYSYISGIENLDLKIFNRDNLYVKMDTLKGTIYAKMSKKLRINKKKHLEVLTVCKDMFWGHIVKPDFKYALFYEGCKCPIFISKRGFSSEYIGGFNAFLDIINDANQLKATITSLISNLKFTIYDIETEKLI